MIVDKAIILPYEVALVKIRAIFAKSAFFGDQSHKIMITLETRMLCIKWP